MNLLERMAEALADVLNATSGGHDGWSRASDLLAEYDRDRKRLVLLRFENARNIECDGKTARFFVMHDGGFGLFRGVYLEDGDYAYAVLPPLPGPEAFKNEEQS